MAEFIEPIVTTLLAILEARMPALCLAAEIPAPATYGRQLSDVPKNLPAIFVRPVRTQFDADSQHTRHQAHQVRIIIAVSSADPEALATLAMQYVAAVDSALWASDPGDWTSTLTSGVVTRVWVAEHDYGPLYETARGLGRLPVVDVIVEAEET